MEDAGQWIKVKGRRRTVEEGTRRDRRLSQGSRAAGVTEGGRVGASIRLPTPVRHRQRTRRSVTLNPPPTLPLLLTLLTSSSFLPPSSSPSSSCCRTPTHFLHHLAPYCPSFKRLVISFLVILSSFLHLQRPLYSCRLRHYLTGRRPLTDLGGTVTLSQQ